MADFLTDILQVEEEVTIDEVGEEAIRAGKLLIMM